MTSQFFAAAASVALIGAGFTGAGTRAIDAMPDVQTAFADGSGAGSDKACRVDVIRSGTPGNADIARQELDSGQCVCIVTTGPASSNGSAENVVTNLLRDKTCGDAPLVGSEAATTGGGSGTLVVTLVAVAGAAGLAFVLGNDTNG
ncbi:MAG: hypothetical protein C0515_13070 [Novosphingobium sp.]|nr:hypothetical protein [Novosphingobium sp.]